MATEEDKDTPASPTPPRPATAPKSPNPDDASQDKAATPAAAATAGSGGGGGESSKRPHSAGVRPRSATMRPPPTLLGDFLLGRPSPARLAADREAARQRRMTLEQVKQEMREANMRKVQAPGGVHDRVKQWQKKNAAAMAASDPYAAPSEPSEVNIQVDEESVTEEDRERIKKRQNRKSAPARAPSRPVIVVEQEKAADEPEKEHRAEPPVNLPPKKRVVSDTNWMKNRKGKSPKKPEASKAPPGRDMLARTTVNPAMKKKIKAWAERVEIPDPPSGKRYSDSRSVGSRSRERSHFRGARSEGGDRESTLSEEVEVIVDDKPRGPRPKTSGDDGVRVSARKKTIEDDGIRIRPSRSTLPDDGIRVRPWRSTLPDDGIRIRPSKSAQPDDRSRMSTGKKSAEDDGIRVRPSTSTLPDDGARGHSRGSGRSESVSTVRASTRQKSAEPSDKATSSRRDASPSDVIEVFEDAESEMPNTPTRRSSGQKSTKLSGKAPAKAHIDTQTDLTEEVSDEDSWTSGSEESDEESDRPPSLPSKLAEIPVGYSAFSELDLPARGSSSKRPKTRRNPSFRDATNVLKHALTQGRKIITERVEPPPRPAANQPRSIESWLNKTVDPFMENEPAPARESQKRPTERVRPSEIRTRRSTSTQQSKSREPNKSEQASELTASDQTASDQTASELTASELTASELTASELTASELTASELTASELTASELTASELTASHLTTADLPSYLTSRIGEDGTITKVTEPEESVISSEDSAATGERSITPTGLKRSRATRNTSSKSSLKKGFKDRFMEAFRGESAPPRPIPTTYPSCSEEIQIDDRPEEDDHHVRRRSSGSKASRSSRDDESLPDSGRSAPSYTHSRRRPPTTGRHELSTILSDETGSVRDSDMASVVSDSTVTKLTRGTGSTLSRNRSNKCGVKRRLTRHSDLVSALSLPDESPRPGRSGSLKSARSVHRTSSHLRNATLDGLLKDFVRDENLFQRELKTLVDGVIPVLLTQVVNGNDSPPRDPLIPAPLSKSREGGMGKSVVQMGIVLEKLRNAHRRCPLSDARRLPQWLESAYPLYNHYIDVWRLGFEDLIVNLAPLSPDDEDSLIGALPRNEQGDVLNEDGQRIDVAHLLKRPLVRVKYISKFIKGYRATTRTERYHGLEEDWEKLQDKSRRKHKEERARVVDEDATNTDVSRVRDLETLAALDNVKIDRFRQVYAKDSFSLSLRHSNGQRLECQVELLYRDNQRFKSDPCDLLIRETGSGGRSWLLFAPVISGQFSARRGDRRHELVLMIRGSRDEWYELLTLTTDNEEQVLEWLDILGTNPIPPEVIKVEASGPQSLILHPQPTTDDAPLGERKHMRLSAVSQSHLRSDSSPDLQTTPSRHHARTSSAPDARNAPSERTASPSPETTPTHDEYSRSRYTDSFSARDEDRSHPLREHMRPDFSSRDDDGSHALHEQMRPEPLDLRKGAARNTESPQEEAPPPPAHRTPLSQKAPTLSPPEPTSGRIKRRTSSPLKHEYHPSDISSEESASSSSEFDEDEDEDESSDAYSSDDELEAADIPDTTPAISIRQSHEPSSDWETSDRMESIPPSASISQTALPRFGTETPGYSFQSTASISFWNNRRGCWRDLWPEQCSVTTTPGLIEVYPLRDGPPPEDEPPLLAMDLTPLVMLRNSTVVDLEIRSPVLSYARFYTKMARVESSFFRFRTASYNDCEALYMAVHRARMDNAKYKALEEEARVRAFGQHHAPPAEDEGGDSSSRRRSWFGRKNSYRASTRAPSQSAPSISHASTQSASSFLKRLMGGGNKSFNIAMSSVGKQNNSQEASLYAPSSGSGTPPRSPSISAANSSRAKQQSLATNNLKIRLHLMITASKWEDHGNCVLEVTRPDQGTRQGLRKYQGLEKRIVVTTIPKKSAKDQTPVVRLDVVLGSRCFSRLGSRGILLNVWEEVRDESGERGVADKGGTNIGQVNKWCFQCASVSEAAWIYGLVTQEVVIGSVGF